MSKLPREDRTGATFVLVQGAWIGGWYWREVADLLTARGHRVFRPTLTGLGERAHLLSRDVGLTTHITDIVNVIEWEELSGIVLAGHSYGGMVISGVAAAVPEGTIRSIVFLDAFFPQSGQSLADIVGEEAAQLFYGDADPIPFPPQLAEGDAGMQRAAERTTPHPRKSKFERLGDVSARARIPVKTFVYATKAQGGFHGATARRLEADPEWRVEAVDCGHMLMIDDPQRTADVLEAAV